MNKCPFKNIAVIIQFSQIIPISRSYSSFIYLPSLNVNIFAKPNSRKQFWISEQCFRCCLSFCLLLSQQMGSNLSQQAPARSNMNTHTKNDVMSPLISSCDLLPESLLESIPGGKSVRLEAIYSKCFGHICLEPRVAGYINLQYMVWAHSLVMRAWLHMPERSRDCQCPVLFACLPWHQSTIITPFTKKCICHWFLCARKW